MARAAAIKHADRKGSGHLINKRQATSAATTAAATTTALGTCATDANKAFVDAAALCGDDAVRDAANNLVLLVVDALANNGAGGLLTGGLLGGILGSGGAGASPISTAVANFRVLGTCAVDANKALAVAYANCASLHNFADAIDDIDTANLFGSGLGRRRRAIDDDARWEK